MPRLLLIVLIFGLSARGICSDKNISYAKRVVLGIPLHVVTVNLNSPNIRISPAIAKHGIGSAEGFGSMLSRLQPTAAITGTFFCVKNLVPVGDIVIDGNRVVCGSVGTGICFGEGNRIEFVPLRELRLSRETEYYHSVICAGPRLVVNGVVRVYPHSEEFNDKSLFRRARRSALGVTRTNKLLMVTTNRPVYLSKLAKIMQQLGAVEAVNLDGGSSTALYFKGRVLSHPLRKLTNLIVVYESPAKFARIKPLLAPSPVVATNGSRS
jgi:hypothetical protein